MTLFLDFCTVLLEGVVNGSTGNELPSPSDLAMLLFSILMLVLGFFFLFEGAKTLKWTFHQDEHAPNAYSGVSLCSVVSGLTILIWVWIYSRQPPLYDSPLVWVMRALEFQPRELA